MIEPIISPFEDPIKAEHDCPCCEWIGDSAVLTPSGASLAEQEIWAHNRVLCAECREEIEDNLEMYLRD